MKVSFCNMHNDSTSAFTAEAAAFVCSYKKMDSVTLAESIFVIIIIGLVRITSLLFTTAFS